MIRVMEDSTAAIHHYFVKLGFEPAIADMYIALCEHGPQTISELSRRSKVERTLIYRLLPKLTETHLIEIESEYKQGIIKASPFTNLQILLTKKEQELQDLQDSLPLLEQSLQRNIQSSPDTKVQFYRGTDGVKQMLWNETKTTGDVLGIFHENIQIKTNSKFFERWVARCNEVGMHSRGIVSDSFISSQQKWYDAHVNERLTNWEERYISPDVFSISHSTVVYDNVVAHYNWNRTEVFGVELYNEQIADTQRQLFEILWGLATPK